MKSFSVFLLALACPVLLFSQWYWQRPDPTGLDLNDIHCISISNAWAVGNGGVVIVTEDGGNTWEQIFTPKLVDLYSVHMINSSLAWACGGNGYVFRSIDGGISFRTISINPGETNFSIYFHNELIGWVAGTDGIHKSNDGGLTWTHQYSEHSINSIEFYDDNIGYAVGVQNTILRTVNGGMDWIECTCPDNFSPRSLSIAGQNTIWSLGSGDIKLIKSVDGAQNWEAMPCPTSYSVTNLNFYSEDLGWVVGWNGLVMKTVNGGSSWTQIVTGYYDYHLAIDFSNTDHGIIVGNSGKVFKCGNGGTSWDRISEPEYPDMEFLTSIQFIDAYTGWIGNKSQNYILATTNGGIDWEKHQLSYSSHIYDIFFIDELNGWAGTLWGIEKTSDGGITWEYLHDLNDCNSVWFFDNLNGLVATNSGLLRTNNGGNSFSEITVNADGNLESIFFLNNNEGWLCSYTGEIFHTTDGGTTWSEQTTPTYDRLEKVFFLNQDLGWASGYGGLIHTDDGGNTWNWQYTTSGTIEDVVFIDPLNGYFARGSIYATTDGGASWVDQEAGGSGMGSIYALSFPESSIGYACGYGATVLKTENGGFVNTKEHSFKYESLVSKIYPNPVKDNFTLEYKLENRSTVDVHIYNSAGQLIKSTSHLQDSGENSLVMSLINYQSGIYFYIIIGEGFNSSGKLIKH